MWLAIVIFYAHYDYIFENVAGITYAVLSESGTVIECMKRTNCVCSIYEILGVKHQITYLPSLLTSPGQPH